MKILFHSKSALKAHASSQKPKMDLYDTPAPCAPSNGSLTLMDLPLEILDMIVQGMSVYDMSNMAVTGQEVRAYIEPHLYRNIYTKTKSFEDTGGLVALLQKRPEIASMIRCLNLDEFHPRDTRRLLAITMLNLTVIRIQHYGHITQTITAREKRRLNRGIRPQPALRGRECIRSPRFFERALIVYSRVFNQEFEQVAISVG